MSFTFSRPQRAQGRSGLAVRCAPAPEVPQGRAPGCWWRRSCGGSARKTSRSGREAVRRASPVRVRAPTVVGVMAGVAPSPPLAEQVPALVDLGLQVDERFFLFGTEPKPVRLTLENAVVQNKPVDEGNDFGVVHDRFLLAAAGRAPDVQGTPSERCGI